MAAGSSEEAAPRVNLDNGRADSDDDRAAAASSASSASDQFGSDYHYDGPSMPHVIVEPSRATVVCGDSHSLAIAASGELYAWGKAYAGRCGIADVTGMPTEDDVPYQPIPRQVVGGGFGDRKVCAVASGRWHNLAVVEGGELYAWGAADAGRCGFADTDGMPRDEDNWPYQPIPRLVMCGGLDGKKVVAVACGENHSLVVTADGDLLAWGSLHMGRCGFADTGALPTDDENHPYQPVPRRVSGSPLDRRRVASVACGTFHSLAITECGELFAWGSACAGRCGFSNLDGLPEDHDGVPYQPVPRQIVDGDLEGRAVVAIACSEGHSYAVTSNGELCAWGNADAGRCGLTDVDSMPSDADGPYQPVPRFVAKFGFPGRSKIRSVACGSWHSLALTQDGDLFAWGAARAGRCGFADVSGLPVDENGPYQPTPRQVVDGGLKGRKVAVVACGSWHSLAATEDGTLYAWGVALMSRCGFDTTGMPIDDLCPYVPTPLAVVAMPKVKLGVGTASTTSPPNGMKSVCEDLRWLLEDEQYADVCFEVDGEELVAHVAILVARSDHFRRMFGSGMAESQVGAGSASCRASPESSSTRSSFPGRRVLITDCGAVAFRQLLIWLYSGRVDDNLPPDELAAVLRLADVYGLPDLRSECERLLSEHISADNVVELVQVATTTHAPDLEAACLGFATENPSAVRNAQGFLECSDAEVMRRIGRAWSRELDQARDDLRASAGYQAHRS